MNDRSNAPPNESSDEGEQTHAHGHRNDRSLRGIVGTSVAIQSLRDLIMRYARIQVPALVTGESGTGKELVARALHGAGPLRRQPFVAANCAAFAPDLLGSELFGHAAGAFTSAHGPHRGLFEQADGGTLFLDEVGELSLSAQAVFLRTLETGEVRPLGTERVRRVHVRIVTATNRNLAAMVESGQFRLDLFYRLAVLVLHLSPLRNRPEDIVPIAEHLLEHLIPELGRRTLSTAAAGVLMVYPWPGNVRQLQNVLRRAGATSDAPELSADTITRALGAETQTASLQSEAPAQPYRTHTIQTALAVSEGKVAPAARLLGIPRSTLRDRLARGRTSTR